MRWWSSTTSCSSSKVRTLRSSREETPSTTPKLKSRRVCSSKWNNDLNLSMYRRRAKSNMQSANSTRVALTMQSSLTSKTRWSRIRRTSPVIAQRTSSVVVILSCLTAIQKPISHPRKAQRVRLGLADAMNDSRHSSRTPRSTKHLEIDLSHCTWCLSCDRVTANLRRGSRLCESRNCSKAKTSSNKSTGILPMALIHHQARKAQSKAVKTNTKIDSRFGTRRECRCFHSFSGVKWLTRLQRNWKSDKRTRV